MMPRILILLTLLSLASWASGATPDSRIAEQYTRGNQAYADGNFAEAVEAYQQALDHGTSANLHYNLANTYAALEAWGPAVLHYRKALALEPQHADARANLRLVQRRADLEPPARTYWEQWAQNLPLTVWIVAASVACWALLAIWLLWGKRVDAPRIRILLTLFCVTVLLAGLPALYGYHLAGQAGIVIAPETALRVAPTEQSPRSSSLQAGESARLRKVVKGFYLVELPSGEEGYLPPEEFEPVWDSAPGPDRDAQQ